MSTSFKILRFLLLVMSAVAIAGPASVLAQSERKLVREGNSAYEAKQYDQAESHYRKSLEKDKSSLPAQYNLGNALFRQDKLEEARSQYEQAANRKDAPAADRAKAFHNLGNSLLKQEKFQESIDAYKQSLRINPGDNDTRYNLAYAQAKLQQQQQQQQQKQDNKQDKDQQKNQDQQQQQNKDQQDKNKQQQDQQQQQDKQQDQAKNDEKQSQKQNPARISKEDAEKILQALNNDEKKTQKKLNKKEAVRVRIEKQW